LEIAATVRPPLVDVQGGSMTSSVDWRSLSVVPTATSA